MLSGNYILIQPTGFQFDAMGVSADARAVLRSVVFPMASPARPFAVTAGITPTHSSPPPSGGFCP